jgi:hypothetical protein
MASKLLGTRMGRIALAAAGVAGLSNGILVGESSRSHAHGLRAHAAHAEPGSPATAHSSWAAWPRMGALGSLLLPTAHAAAPLRQPYVGCSTAGVSAGLAGRLTAALLLSDPSAAVSALVTAPAAAMMSGAELTPQELELLERSLVATTLSRLQQWWAGWLLA